VGCKLYCGNLSYNFSKADLEELFAPFGDVRSADVIMDRDTGRSKGFGFVEMADSGDAQKAIQALNDSMVDGRPLKVNEAKPREERSGAGGGGYNRGGGGGGYNRGGGGGGGGRRY
jgi:cold-inducible RNA-binding protein